MDGFWHEVGPFRVDKQDDTRIYRNPKSWAKIANMVFLEAPIGTGFSYTEATDTPHVGDETTALDSYTFLERFLGPDYFPQFQPHAFHIWGESYGGICECTTQASMSHTYPQPALGRAGRFLVNGCVDDRYTDPGEPDPAQ
eukprot:SAG31_NODE_893_length_11177_cov_10.241806_6_plen_141_part_00